MSAVRNIGAQEVQLNRPFLHDQLLVNPAFQRLFHELSLRRYEDLAALLGRIVPLKQQSTCVDPVLLSPRTGGGVAAYYKQYTFSRPSKRYWMRPSKALREFRNYGVFERLGIRCPERIACGEKRDRLGRLCHAVLLTRTIENARPLSEFLRQATTRAVRDSIFRQVAEGLAKLHRARFYHNDVHWRNLLLQSTPDSPPMVWWIDCPRGRFDWTVLGSRRRIKDLAELLAGSIGFCTNRERIKFFRDYLGERRLTPRSRTLARATVRFWKAHWPDAASDVRRHRRDSAAPRFPS
jgi:hypothetical protein